MLAGLANRHTSKLVNFKLPNSPEVANLPVQLGNQRKGPTRRERDVTIGFRYTDIFTRVWSQLEREKKPQPLTELRVPLTPRLSDAMQLAIIAFQHRCQFGVLDDDNDHRRPCLLLVQLFRLTQLIRFRFSCCRCRGSSCCCC